MGTSFENGISVSFWAFLENNAKSSIWKRDFPFFGLVMGTSGKQCQYLLFKNGISVVLFGLWWQPLGNNINIFYLKTGFPLFFLACDGNLWKIISISSIWKRNFRVFLGLWREPHLKTGFPCLFGLFWKIMPISSIWKRDFLFFWACDGNLWKIMPISSIWKRNFGVFSGLVMGNLIWKRDFRVFLGFSGK